MKKTVIFIIFMVLAIFVFDVYIIVKEGSLESISAYIIRWSMKHPSLPFLCGFLCGHLFWRMPDKSIYWGDK